VLRPSLTAEALPETAPYLFVKQEQNLTTAFSG